MISFAVAERGNIQGKQNRAENDFTEDFEGYVNFNRKSNLNTRRKSYFSGFLDNVKPSKGKWTKILESGTLGGTFALAKK